MAVEQHKLGSYRLEAAARDVLESNSHVRDSVAAWILDLREHRAKTPVLSVATGRVLRTARETGRDDSDVAGTSGNGSVQTTRNDNDRLRKKLKLEWNYNSNHIEGNTLTYHETELLLRADLRRADLVDRVGEGAHDVEAVELQGSLTAWNIPFSDQDSQCPRIVSPYTGTVIKIP